MLSIFNSKTSIGLDIQTSEIRLLQLRQRRSYHSVEKFAIRELPPHAILEGQIKENGAVLNVFNELARLTQTKGQPVVMTIPSQNLITTRIKLSCFLKGKELEAEIKANLTRFFPGISSELSFDFVIMGQENEQYDILLIATRTQLLNEYVRVAQAAGFVVKRVDSPLLAIIRTVPLFHPLQEYLGILETTASSAQFIILRNQDIVLNQQLPLVSANEMTLQLNQFFQTFRATNKDCLLQYLYCVGDKTLFLQMEQQLKEESHLKVLSTDIFSTLQKSKQVDTAKLSECSHRMIISYGLALRS